MLDHQIQFNFTERIRGIEGAVRQPPHSLRRGKISGHCVPAWRLGPQGGVGVVEDVVHNCLGNWSAGIRIWVNTGISALELVLGTEDHGAWAASFYVLCALHVPRKIINHILNRFFESLLPAK